MKRKILKYPKSETALRRVAAAVAGKKGIQAARQVCQDLIDTVRSCPTPALGLAATQIGIRKQVLIMRLVNEEIPGQQKWTCLVNPKIVDKDKRTVRTEEGCLSFPGVMQLVERPYQVTVEFQNLSGKKIKGVFYDMESVIVQHEIDHLNGVLFVDY